jgi:hypothetical protein
LDYTVTLTNGRMAVPTGSSLNITVGHAILGNVTCSNLALETNITAAPTLAANATVTCTFAVNVTETEKTSQQVPAFPVNAAFGLAAAGIIYLVPAATSAVVPVFNGASYIYGASQAVTGPSVTGEFAMPQQCYLIRMPHRFNACNAYSTCSLSLIMYTVLACCAAA